MVEKKNDKETVSALPDLNSNVRAQFGFLSINAQLVKARAMCKLTE